MNFIYTYQTLPDIFYQSAVPDSSADARIAVFNAELAKTLGIAGEQEVLSWVNGKDSAIAGQAIAQAYAGHQFGQLNRLGDGRATLLGEVQTGTGLYDIHLKGCGRTPYSRHGDGKANLAPMLREHLIAEAMHALGVPTTRSLAVVDTGELVRRREHRKGAVLARVASSHIRVGTFVYALVESYNRGDFSALQALCDYAIERHYPECASADNPAFSLLEAVIETQAATVAHWQRVGFVHGVMNTDNVTISGETIDYGPCAFMDRYHEDTVFSSIDAQGRYAFANQPPVMQWNMSRFAESLLSLIDEDETTAVNLVSECVERFSEHYYQQWNQALCAKLGIGSEHARLAEKLLSLMQQRELDYTNTFVSLTLHVMGYETELPHDEQLDTWLTQWKELLDENSVAMMQKNNPIVIPRNHLVERALSTVESGNMRYFHELYAVLQSPYDWGNIERYKDFMKPAPESWREEYQTFCGT